MYIEKARVQSGQETNGVIKSQVGGDEQRLESSEFEGMVQEST